MLKYLPFLLAAALSALVAPAMAEETQQTVILMLGAPGSGKGTQAARLSRTYGYPHISTGDLLRDEIARESEVGRKASTYMAEGKLVPDELILEVLFSRIDQPDCARGYILDGFPRTLSQAVRLRETLDDARAIVFNLNASDDQILSRIGDRVICEGCKAPYNTRSLPPSSEGVCDQCGGKLVTRPDDTADVMRQRLHIYHEQTEPLIVFYQRQGIIHHVDSQKPMETVYEELVGTLHSQERIHEAAACGETAAVVPQ